MPYHHLINPLSYILVYRWYQVPVSHISSCADSKRLDPGDIRTLSHENRQGLYGHCLVNRTGEMIGSKESCTGDEAMDETELTTLRELPVCMPIITREHKFSRFRQVGEFPSALWVWCFA